MKLRIHGNALRLRVKQGEVTALAAGTVEINGIDLRVDPVGVKRTIGVLPEDLALFDALTAGHAGVNFVHVGGCYDCHGLSLLIGLSDGYSPLC